MHTLAFDTTASTLSVALLSDEKVLAKNTILERGKQSELLIPEIEKILDSQKIWYEDLGLISATNGPGSFTGSRIGLTVARTLKASTNLPLILLNSCEVVAYKYREHSGKIFVALDASMDEFFCAEFFAENKKIYQVTAPHLVKAEDLENNFPQDDFFLCGKGDLIEADLVGLLALEKFREGKNTENWDPLYLRMPRIEERKK